MIVRNVEVLLCGYVDKHYNINTCFLSVEG